MIYRFEIEADQRRARVGCWMCEREARGRCDASHLDLRAVEVGSCGVMR